MSREEQIKEMTQDFINFGITTRQGVEAFAEILYNAGYRKTFTSDFASNTQKAYKEGYIKGIEETEAEMERLKAQLSEFEKPITQFVKDRETQAVKEFAEELKKKVHNYYPSIDSYCTSRHVILVKDIDELLKENDNETS